MTHTHTAERALGTWLATASFLMIATLLLHGPIAPDLGEQMTRVAGAPLRWSIAHWLAAAGLSLFAVSGLIALTSRSELTDGLWPLTAWAVVTVGALWTMTTAVAETTVVAQAAADGRTETFNAWWAFSEGKANGFVFLALAVAIIAGSEARSSRRTTPVWAAWTAMVAGLASFGGWAVGMWLGVPLGSLIWVVASVVMSGWTLWLGVVLARGGGPARIGQGTSREEAFL